MLFKRTRNRRIQNRGKLLLGMDELRISRSKKRYLRFKRQKLGINSGFFEGKALFSFDFGQNSGLNFLVNSGSAVDIGL